MSSLLVTVVVLAHNNYSDTFECVASLRELDYQPLRVMLVDNGSTDGTAQRTRADFPWVDVVQTARNLGVAGGFNCGIVRALDAGAEAVFILNNDTVVAPSLISELVKANAEVGCYGILMPKILHYDEPRRIWSVGARYRRFPPTIVMRGLDEPDDGRFDQVEEIAFAPTCGLMIPRQTFERVGLLDDGYFFFFDDWDFSMRVRRAGMQVLYVPEALLFHKVSRTIQRQGRPPFYWRTWGASGARYYRRYGRPPIVSAVVHLGYLALREGLRSGPRAAFHFLQGASQEWKLPPSSPPALPSEISRV